MDLDIYVKDTSLIDSDKCIEIDELIDSTIQRFKGEIIHETFFSDSKYWKKSVVFKEDLNLKAFTVQLEDLNKVYKIPNLITVDCLTFSDSDRFWSFFGYVSFTSSVILLLSLVRFLK